MSRILLEIVCETIDDALAAERAGADRLELCSGLEAGGLTPSLGFALETLALVGVPFVAMVRPRRGDFVYTTAQLAVMERDVGLLLEAGASGVVFGCLSAERQVAEGQVARLVAAGGDAETVFHRAFDRVGDPMAELEALIELGITRVLTSGGAKTALEGADRIRALIERAAGRIEILPAGGIREHNVEEVIRRTGCSQVHLSRR
jgi:copper homeostasis protein